MMKKWKINIRVLLTILVFLSFCKILKSQDIRHHSKCLETSTTSGLGASRHSIINSEISKKPFDRILHYGFKWSDDREHYATAAFISDNMLITARHCVGQKESIEYIELALPANKKDKWIKFSNKEYKIYYYTKYVSNPGDDIAIIEIKNKIKLSLLYKGCFYLPEFDFWKIKDTCNLGNISGFPCDKFSMSKNPDTLDNRTFPMVKICVNQDTTLAFYPAAIYPGDSGGPLWTKIDSRFYLLAITNGFNNPKFCDCCPNTTGISAIINDQVKKWIKSIAKSNWKSEKTRSKLYLK